MVLLTEVSIHSLRKKGDGIWVHHFLCWDAFQSTPFARRETGRTGRFYHGYYVSIHSLRKKGDKEGHPVMWDYQVFQSTPFARRETIDKARKTRNHSVSIHSLRKKGDNGWKRERLGNDVSIHSLRKKGDLIFQTIFLNMVSIHSLRKKGDRRTGVEPAYPSVSIHSLRKKGDQFYQLSVNGLNVSIHSLRKKGDKFRSEKDWRDLCFNPLPSQEGRPRYHIITLPLYSFNPLPSQEGRPSLRDQKLSPVPFQSTPFARRETIFNAPSTVFRYVSIHSLRKKGDTKRTPKELSLTCFNPLPSQEGRQTT